MKKNRVNLSSPNIVLPSVFLASVLFMWSNNWHMYARDSIAFSFIVALALAGLLYGASRLTAFLWNKFRLGDSRPMRAVGALLLACLLVGLLISVLRIPFMSFATTTGARKLVGILAVVILFVPLFFARSSFIKFVNLFALASVALSISTIVPGVMGQTGGNVAAGEADGGLSLRRTPNIYLFWQESLNDFEVVDRIYETRFEAEFEPVLEERGFVMYDNVYANSWSTLLSMTDMFSMRLHSVEEKGNLDVSFAARLLIGGDSSNRLFRIMKENGYYTTLITEGNSYYHNGQIGRYLDSTDFTVVDFNVHHFMPLLALNQKVARYAQAGGDNARRVASANGYSGTLKDRVVTAMDNARAANRPLFVSFKGGAAHTPADGTYTWADREEWVTSGAYQGYVKRGMDEAVDIIDMILERDDQAMIVFIGDHGSWRLRGIMDEVDYAGEGVPVLAKFLEGEGESLDSLADDIFKIALAIRLPEGRKDISYGYPMCHVNLFRHIFAYLNDDRALLEDR